MDARNPLPGLSPFCGKLRLPATSVGLPGRSAGLRTARLGCRTPCPALLSRSAGFQASGFGLQTPSSGRLGRSAGFQTSRLGLRTSSAARFSRNAGFRAHASASGPHAPGFRVGAPTRGSHERPGFTSALFSKGHSDAPGQRLLCWKPAVVLRCLPFSVVTHVGAGGALATDPRDVPCGGPYSVNRNCLRNAADVQGGGSLDATSACVANVRRGY